MSMQCECLPKTSASSGLKLKIIGSAIVLIVIILIGFVLVQFVYLPTVNKSTDIEEEFDQLISAQTLCRHGDRNIYESYSQDPWNSVDFWPGGYGALTDIGKKEHYELGRYFRERYAKLIGTGEYSAQNIFVHSSDVDRVILSAKYTLFGLFSTHYDQNWIANFDPQSYSVFSEPRDQDFLLVAEKQCDRFDYEVIKYIETTEYRTLFEENELLLKYLEEHTGIELKTLTTINHLYDKFFVEQLRGCRLPSWAEEVMKPDGNFKYLAEFGYQIQTRTTEMKKLKSGYLLKEILDRFSNKTQSLLTQDLWMYFGHDSTVASMLNSLGLFEIHRPPYASCLLFELHRTETQNYIQLFYKNSTETIISAFNIPNCGGTKCPLNKWYEMYENILPTQSFEEECELREGEILPAGGNPEGITH